MLPQYHCHRTAVGETTLLHEYAGNEPPKWRTQDIRRGVKVNDAMCPRMDVRVTGSAYARTTADVPRSALPEDYKSLAAFKVDRLTYFSITVNVDRFDARLDLPLLSVVVLFVGVLL